LTEGRRFLFFALLYMQGTDYPHYQHGEVKLP
jgi:hypothetical protein